MEKKNFSHHERGLFLINKYVRMQKLITILVVLSVTRGGEGFIYIFGPNFFSPLQGGSIGEPVP